MYVDLGQFAWMSLIKHGRHYMVGYILSVTVDSQMCEVKNICSLG